MDRSSAASTPGDAGQLGVSNDPACKRAAQVTSAAYTTQPFPYFIPSVFFWPYIYIWQAKGALNV